MFRIIHRKLKFDEDLGGGGDLFPIIYLKGDVYFFPDRRFYSGQRIIHFIYLIIIICVFSVIIVTWKSQ